MLIVCRCFARVQCPLIKFVINLICCLFSRSLTSPERDNAEFWSKYVRAIRRCLLELEQISVGTIIPELKSLKKVFFFIWQPLLYENFQIFSKHTKGRKLLQSSVFEIMQCTRTDSVLFLFSRNTKMKLILNYSRIHQKNKLGE